MAFIRRIFSKEFNLFFYYVMIKKKHNGKWKDEIVRDATKEEIEDYHSRRHQEKTMTIMCCDNPNCDKVLKVSRAKKFQLNVTDPKKGKLEFEHCSTKCRNEHLAALGGK